MLNKIKALVEAQEITIDEIIEAMVNEEQLVEQSDHNENQFEYDGMEFLIVTEEEAIKEHDDSIESLWDDMGLQSFSESAQEHIINNFALNSEWFDEAMQESYESYCEDIKTEDVIEDEEGNETNRLTEEMEENNCETEEDYIEHLCNGWEDGAEWYKMNFGEEQFSEVAKKYLNFDIDAIAEYCRDTDGIAHSLARYDGNEEEVEIDEETYYIYRTD